MSDSAKPVPKYAELKQSCSFCPDYEDKPGVALFMCVDAAICTECVAALHDKLIHLDLMNEEMPSMARH